MTCDNKCTTMENCVSRSTLRKLIAEHSAPEAATDNTQTHIYMVWYDGEVTMQKCNDLLWQRRLHLVQFKVAEDLNLGEFLPEEIKTGKFVFVKDDKAAAAIRNEMRDMHKLI